jgi:hypothetical protein
VVIDDLRREHVQQQEELRMIDQQLAEVTKQQTEDEQFIVNAEHVLLTKESSGLDRLKELKGSKIASISAMFHPLYTDTSFALSAQITSIYLNGFMVGAAST